MSREYFDLNRLAVHLGENGDPHPVLRKKLRALASLHAVFMDLVAAQRFAVALNVMLRTPAADRTLGWITHADALMISAVTAYSRALHNDPTPDRLPQSLGLLAKEPFKSRDQRVKKWRNHVIAHYGRGEEIVGYAAIDDRPLIIVEDGVWQSVMPSNRGMLSETVFGDLCCLLDAAVPAIKEKVLNSSGEVTPLLATSEEGDTDLQRALSASRIDPKVEYADHPGLMEQLMSGGGEPGRMVSGLASREL